MNCRGLGGVPDPVPVTGSQEAVMAIAATAASENEASRMKNAPKPPRFILWWEKLEPWQHLALSFPVFAVLTFLINIGPFNQPILRSVFYGVFEGAVLSILLAVATRTERGKR